MSPSRQRIERPFADWPHTEYLDDEQAFRITGRYRAPSGWWENGFPILVGLAYLVLTPTSCVYVLTDMERRGEGDQIGGAIVGIYVAAVLSFMAIIAVAGYLGTRRNLNVKLSRDIIEIRGKRYSRAAPHQFSVEEHEKAFDEARRRQSSRLYREAMQVVMRYGEKRVPVADFSRKHVRKAEALLVRLQLLDSGMEEMLRAAQGGTAAAPGERDDFGPARPIR